MDRNPHRGVRVPAKAGLEPGLTRQGRLYSQISATSREIRLTRRSCLRYQASMTAKMERLGELLSDARKRRQLTLRAVQDAVGISNAYLSQLETGKVQSPSPVVLHKLSELYELSYAVI